MENIEIKKALESFFTSVIRKAVRDELRSNPFLPEKQDENEFLTAQESADFIGDALQTFYGRTSRGEINTYGSGKRIFCKKSELTAWKEKQRTKSKEALKEEVRTRARNKNRAK